jgi:hypothetical protein
MSVTAKIISIHALKVFAFDLDQAFCALAHDGKPHWRASLPSVRFVLLIILILRKGSGTKSGSSEQKCERVLPDKRHNTGG